MLYMDSRNGDVSIIRLKAHPSQRPRNNNVFRGGCYQGRNKFIILLLRKGFGEAHNRLQEPQGETGTAYSTEHFAGLPAQIALLKHS